VEPRALAKKKKRNQKGKQKYVCCLVKTQLSENIPEKKKRKKKAEKSGRPNWDKMIEIGNFLKTGIFLPPFH